jgi:citrate lyase subunit alpha/citrate CoA-transferase
VRIEDLYAIATGIIGEGDLIPVSDRIACIVQYRDGAVIDTIRRIRKGKA